MAKTCIKCGYVRRDTDTGPDYACPACGVVYAKAEAAAAQAAVTRARVAAIPPAVAKPVATQQPLPDDDAKARADALIRQFALAQAGGARKPSPYRGMALVALLAFALGFGSAAGLYSAAAKFTKKTAAAQQKCLR